MRILVDLDETLQDLITPWVEALNETYGYNVNPNEIDRWELDSFFIELSEKELFSVCNSKEFWAKVKPIPGAIHYLSKLIAEGNEVYVCTSTHYRELQHKIEVVIKKYFPFIKYSNIIVTSKKQLVKADYLIDDYIKNLIGGSYKGILFTRNHNKFIDISEYSNIIRLDTWEDIYNYLKSCPNYGD